MTALFAHSPQLNQDEVVGTVKNGPKLHIGSTSSSIKGCESNIPQDFHSNRVRLHHDESLSRLKSFPSSVFDSIVTDPPYALVSIVKRFGSEKASACKVKSGGTGAYSRASAGFMGQTWDTGETAFAVEFWSEVLRVLKPGGHLVAFGGTRTYHRLACAIEDAGFEIRDSLFWLYGTGFPKNHSVDLGLWKGAKSCLSNARAPFVEQLSVFRPLASRGAKEPIAVAAAQILPEGVPALLIRTGREADSSGLTAISLSPSEAAAMSSSTGWSWPDLLAESSDPRSMYTTETREKAITCPTIYRLLTLSHTQKSTLNSVILPNGWSWPAATAVVTSSAGVTNKSAIPILTVAGPATWNPVLRMQGFGTSLKPGTEPICLARKPLIGSVAENVAAYGVGALNIDGCRIATDDELRAGACQLWSHQRKGEATGQRPSKVGAAEGRFPANVLHDGSAEVVALFPESNGQQGAITGDEPSPLTGNVYGQFAGRPASEPRGDTGSAARFFYSAKAGKLDRLGSLHPTVKPVDLMRWLVRLVTPPGGLILDPFAGSGTTGHAAVCEGMRAVLIEREAKFCRDIARRMERMDPNGQPKPRKKPARPRPPDPWAGTMFEGSAGATQIKVAKSSCVPRQNRATLATLAQPSKLAPTTDSASGAADDSRAVPAVLHAAE